MVIDELFDAAGAAAMVELCERFGAYRMYAEHEQLDTDIGRGLSQRHDSLVNFIRTGGRFGRDESPKALAVRTSYFREEYAYGTTCASTASSRSSTTRRSSTPPAKCTAGR